MNIVCLLAALMTAFGEKVTSENCWREYPRPQMVRASWTCLNGDWDYAVTSVTNTPGRPTKWDGKIRVPYPIESALSGVGRLLEPDEFLWYTRTIDCAPKKGERILLHFDGVDFRTMVFVGHDEVTDVPHEGAQEPFTLDITDFVKPGANELTVCVWDPTEDFVGSRGKQCLKPSGCFYTRCSGIWQSVWMETVPETYIADYDVVPDIDNGTVRFTFDTVGPKRDEEVEVEVFDASGKKIAKAEEDAPTGVTLKMPEDFTLWSPEEPNLYAFKAKFEKDVVEGYFAMRKFAKGKDAKGVLRFMLNNKPYYVMGTLDQGWWPDGLLTPPSEEAMAFDIRTLKDCGFNAMRKHIKVESRRYYALCDKMGLLVLQDLPSAADFVPKIAQFATDPKNMRTYGFQRQELKAMIDNLRKVPSIVMWVPYNEGWSQPGAFLTHATLDWVKRYDPTRLVDGPSGWNDYEGGSPVFNCHPKWEFPHKPADECEAADVIDQHCYRGPEMPPVNARRISFLGEFGGLGHPVSNHLWKVANSWGYGGIEDTKTREGLEKTYLGLMDKLVELAAEGLSGSIYTQTTDVEIEINGLMTYDRKVLKFNSAVLRRAHEKVVSQVCPLTAAACAQAEKPVCHCADTGVCTLPAGECDSVGSPLRTPLADKIAQKHEVIRQDAWYGGRRTVFEFQGFEAWVVEPPAGVPVAEGKPWTWTMQWKTAFVPRTGVPQLLKRGWHHVTIDTFERRMDEEGLRVSAAFQKYLVEELGLAPKANLIGMSWGGFFSCRYAATYPQNVAKIYLDCPFLNLGGTCVDLDIGPWKASAPENWLDDPRMPVNLSQPIADAKIPVLLVYGGADNVLDPKLNSEVFIPRFKAAGGDLKVIYRAAYAHHPHGFEEDEATIIDFFCEGK